MFKECIFNQFKKYIFVTLKSFISKFEIYEHFSMLKLCCYTYLTVYKYYVLIYCQQLYKLKHK
jgi:hypothetical protein